VKQLPKEFPGVIVVQSGSISLNQTDIEYAIFGDPIIYINPSNGSATLTFCKEYLNQNLTPEFLLFIIIIAFLRI